jgi:predicted transposase
MDVHLTIKAKLITTTDAAKELKSTMEEFSRAGNTISQLSFQQDLRRKYDIHHAAYRFVREEKNWPAQHVINAIAKVSAAFVREPDKLHQFNPHSSVRYDARTIVLGEDCHTASLTVCPKGRVTGRLQRTLAAAERKFSVRTRRIARVHRVFQRVVPDRRAADDQVGLAIAGSSEIGGGTHELLLPSFRPPPSRLHRAQIAASS